MDYHRHQDLVLHALQFAKSMQELMDQELHVLELAGAFETKVAPAASSSCFARTMYASANGPGYLTMHCQILHCQNLAMNQNLRCQMISSYSRQHL